MKTKTQQEIEKEYIKLTLNEFAKVKEEIWTDGYNIAKQEAEAKEKEFIEKLKKEFSLDLDNEIIDKLSQEVFGGEDGS